LTWVKSARIGGLHYDAAMLPHYLQPLLAPKSVALVGATEREGALGAIVWRNLAAAGLRGELTPVNPKHRSVFGQRAYARLTDLPQVLALPRLRVIDRLDVDDHIERP